MVKPLTATSSKICPQSPAYVLPDKLYAPKSGNNKLTDGDKEALSMIIASYAYTSDIRDMMRFVTVLSSTIQSYLVKTGRYNDYVVAFNEMNAYIAQARVLLDAKNYDKCAIILYSLETALKSSRKGEDDNTGASLAMGGCRYHPMETHNMQSRRSTKFGNLGRAS